MLPNKFHKALCKDIFISMGILYPFCTYNKTVEFGKNADSFGFSVWAILTYA